MRVHEPVSLIDFLDSTSVRHTFSLDQAQAAIAKDGKGVIVMLRGQGGNDDVLAALQPQAPAQRPAAKWDPRLYGIGAQILRDLGVRKMKLLASPRRMPSVAGFDLEVTGHIASPAELN